MTTRRSMDDIEAMRSASGLIGDFTRMVADCSKKLGIDGEDWRKIVTKEAYIMDMLRYERHRVRFSEHKPFGQGAANPDEGFRSLYLLKSTATVDMLVQACNELGWRLLHDDDVERARDWEAITNDGRNAFYLVCENPLCLAWHKQRFRLHPLVGPKSDRRLGRDDVLNIGSEQRKGVVRAPCILVKVATTSRMLPVPTPPIREVMSGRIPRRGTEHSIPWVLLSVENLGGYSLLGFYQGLTQLGYGFFAMRDKHRLEAAFKDSVLPRFPGKFADCASLARGYFTDYDGQNRIFLPWEASWGEHGGITMQGQAGYLSNIVCDDLSQILVTRSV